MQPVTPEIQELLIAKNLVVSYGADLLDANDVFVEDLTEQVTGGQVNRDNYADIHGTCSVSLLQELDWTSARVRLYQTLSIGPHIEQVEVEDRPAVEVSQTENSAESWGTGAFTNTIVVAGALCLNHA